MAIDTLSRDLRFAVRLLRRAPGFTLTAAATVALGIGATTAIFSVVHGLLLKPLPYPQPEAIVTLWQDMQARGGPAREWATPGNLADWRAETAVFSNVAAVRGWAPTLTGEGEPEPLVGEQVTHGYFEVLGVQPASGRLFRFDEALPNAPRVAIISHGLWQRRFNGAADVIGRRVLLSGEPHEIVGVLPAAFRPAIVATASVWRPDRLNLVTPSRGAVVLRVVARLRPDVDLAAASAAMAALGRRLESAYPEANQGVTFSVVPFHEFVVGNVRPALIAVFGAVLFVLLIACVSIANLLLARASGRAQEMAVRAALGAGRRRVVGQLAMEGLVLAALGGAAGVAASIWGTRALVALAPTGTPRLGEVGLDAGVLAFAAAATLGTGLLCGLAPAYSLIRQQRGGALRDDVRGGAAPAGRRMRRALVVVEIAVAIVLLVESGLFYRSFVAVRTTDLGFDPRSVLTGLVILPAASYPTEAHQREFFARLVEKAGALPGVSRAALTSILPLDGGDSDMDFHIEGAPPPASPDEATVTWYRLITDGYFEAMGVALREGRGFHADEPAPVVIVNEALADRYWPNGDALGRRLRFGPDSPWFTIVGVAADIKQTGARGATRMQTFLYYPQVPQLSNAMAVVLKTATTPDSLAQPLRQVVRDLDPDLPVSNVATMASRLAASIDQPRFLAFLVGLFAALAVAIAVVGLYGLMAYAVTERRREIGVRLALGAGSREILRLVLGDGLRLAAAGIAIGAAGAAILAPAVRGLLFGVPPADPLTFAITTAGLFAVAIAAAAVPARQALRVDPVAALRGD
jgi:predicted permease